MTIQRDSHYLEMAERLMEESSCLNQEDALRLMNSIASKYGFTCAPDPSKGEWITQGLAALDKCGGNKINALRLFRDEAGVDLMTAKNVIEAAQRALSGL